MDRLKRAFEAYARWRVGRCREQSPLALVVAGLFLASALLLLWLGLRGAAEGSAATVVSGMLVFTVGWSGIGQVFWEHQVWKLKVEIERLSRQGE